MHERHQSVEIAVGIDERVLDVARMAGRVAQPDDARNFGETIQQLAERPGLPVGTVAMIGVDVLPDEGDFAHAVACQALDVLDDLRHRAYRTKPLALPSEWVFSFSASMFADFVAV